VISDGAYRVGVVTDLGTTTPYVEMSLTGCDALVLECNHDLELLAQSDYPLSLRQRISGRFGHLHNEGAAALLRSLDTNAAPAHRRAHLFAAEQHASHGVCGARRGAQLRGLSGSASRRNRTASPGASSN